MPEDDDSGDTLSEAQELITKIVAVSTVNRWNFSVDFNADGSTDIAISVPGGPMPDVQRRERAT